MKKAVTVTLPVSLIEKINAIAGREKRNKNTTYEILLEEGLKSLSK